MPTVEFGTKDTADDVREQYEEHLCSDDDRRLKTVTFASDTPEDVLDRVTVRAARTRADRDGSGQQPLTDSERDRIDFSQPRASVPHARAVKAIATQEGVDDWLAYYDGTLTVDEHRDVMAEAAQDEQGQRMDSQDTTDERLGRAEKALGEECDHARGHCRNGDPDACEYLSNECGLTDDEVDALLSDDEPTDDGDEITGEAAGALGRSWSGYKGALAGMADALPQVREEWENAQQAARAINEIRAAHGQDPIHFERLEELQAEIADLTRKAAADCHECHADHSRHDHAVTDGDREDIREFADEGRGETPVGSGGEHGDDPTDEGGAA